LADAGLIVAVFDVPKDGFSFGTFLSADFWVFCTLIYVDNQKNLRKSVKICGQKCICGIWF
jgi:hypothetical protein